MEKEEQVIGDPIPILKILQHKRFKVKIPKDKTQREWFQADYFFTVDKNVILFNDEERKIHMKIKQKGLNVKRISENIVEMHGMEEGFFLDSKVK